MDIIIIFIFGVGCGFIFIHLLYLSYFHFVILKRIDELSKEIDKFIEEYVKKQNFSNFLKNRV